MVSGKCFHCEHLFWQKKTHLFRCTVLSPLANIYYGLCISEAISCSFQCVPEALFFQYVQHSTARDKYILYPFWIVPWITHMLFQSKEIFFKVEKVALCFEANNLFSFEPNWTPLFQTIYVTFSNRLSYYHPNSTLKDVSKLKYRPSFGFCWAFNRQHHICGDVGCLIFLLSYF